MRKIDGRFRLDLLSTVGTFLLIDHPLVETIQMKRVSARERPSASGPYFLQTNGAVDVFILRIISARKIRTLSRTIIAWSTGVRSTLFRMILEIVDQTNCGKRYDA